LVRLGRWRRGCGLYAIWEEMRIRHYILLNDLESVTPLCCEWAPEMHGYGYRGEEVIKKCTRALGHSGRHRGCGRVWEEGEGRSHDAAMD
jgi:hypothetical protein